MAGVDTSNVGSFLRTYYGDVMEAEVNDDVLVYNRLAKNARVVTDGKVFEEARSPEHIGGVGATFDGEALPSAGSMSMGVIQSYLSMLVGVIEIDDRAYTAMKKGPGVWADVYGKQIETFLRDWKQNANRALLSDGTGRLCRRADPSDITSPITISPYIWSPPHLHLYPGMECMIMSTDGDTTRGTFKITGITAGDSAGSTIGISVGTAITSGDPYDYICLKQGYYDRSSSTIGSSTDIVPHSGAREPFGIWAHVSQGNPPSTGETGMVGWGNINALTDSTWRAAWVDTNGGNDYSIGTLRAFDPMKFVEMITAIEEACGDKASANIEFLSDKRQPTNLTRLVIGTTSSAYAQAFRWGPAGAGKKGKFEILPFQEDFTVWGHPWATTVWFPSCAIVALDWDQLELIWTGKPSWVDWGGGELVPQDFSNGIRAKAAYRCRLQLRPKGRRRCGKYANVAAF